MDSGMVISFLGIIIGVAVFIFMSFKRANITFAAGIGAIIIICFNGFGASVTAADGTVTDYNVLTALTNLWVTGMGNALRSYFLIFVLGGIFGKILDITGGAKAIAFALLRPIKKAKKNPYFFAVYFIVLMYFILTYVGVHGFIIVFTVMPLGRELYHDLDIPWRYYCYGSGGCIPAYYLLGSVSSVPAITAAAAGTHVGALPVMSIIMSIVFFIVQGLIVNWDVNRAIKKGDKFLPAGEEIWKQQMEVFKETDDLPQIWQPLIPMIVMIVIAALGIGTEIALAVGCVLGIIFNFSVMKDKILSTFSSGTASVFSALFMVCAAAGLGTVIRNMKGYGFINTALDSAPPMVAGVILCMFGTVLLGSSSASVPAFGSQEVGYFTAAGLTEGQMFRLMTACTNFMYPPQNTGVVNASATAKVPYSQAVWVYIKSTLPANIVVIIVTLILIGLGMNI